MPVRYKYLRDDKIFLAIASGALTVEDNMESNARVKAEFDKRPGMKLVVDLREATIDATPVLFIGMMEAFFDLVGSRLPVAVVNTEIPDGTSAMLAETKAFIAGAQMRFFDSRDMAIRWLNTL